MKRAFLRFCLHFGCTPVPAAPQTIIYYTVFLARSLSPSSIPGYLNIIKLMHAEQGLPDPLDNWELHSVNKGINRCLGRPPKQKLPITVHILHKIYDHLDLSNSMQGAFWTASLVAFFAFLRKSTLLPKSSSPNDIVKSLCVKDLTLEPNGSLLMLHIRHTKTIQFGQRHLDLPISAASDSVLCPVNAVVRMLSHFTPGSLIGDHPLFSYKDSQGNTTFLTHLTFVKLLRALLKKCGVDASQYSGHSFRRGGCTHAFSLGISPMLIKLRGDWRSNAYERYVFIQPEQHLQFAKSLSLSVS